MSADKPDLRERLGAALNTSDLRSDSRERPSDIIGALGFTQLNPEADAHDEHELVVIDARSELGAMLMRLKYGGDRVLGDRAATLLVWWMRRQRAYAKWKLRPNGEALLAKFARQALAEWLYPVCPACNGRRYRGLERDTVIAKRVRCNRCRGRGEVSYKPSDRLPGGAFKRRSPKLDQERIRTTRLWMQCASCHGMGKVTIQRKVTEDPGDCRECNGTGNRLANDVERALSLGIDQQLYQRHWLRRFDWLSSGLDRLDMREKHCLQAQMERGIKRT